MPGFDKTGPLGTGPNGRGLGPCGSGQAFGRRRFFGFGRGGFGLRWNALSAQTPEDENASLEQEKTWIESQLSAINERIEKNKGS